MSLFYYIQDNGTETGPVPSTIILDALNDGLSDKLLVRQIFDQEPSEIRQLIDNGNLAAESDESGFSDLPKSAQNLAQIALEYLIYDTCDAHVKGKVNGGFEEYEIGHLELFTDAQLSMAIDLLKKKTGLENVNWVGCITSELIRTMGFVDSAFRNDSISPEKYLAHRRVDRDFPDNSESDAVDLIGFQFDLIKATGEDTKPNMERLAAAYAEAFDINEDLFLDLYRTRILDAAPKAGIDSEQFTDSAQVEETPKTNKVVVGLVALIFGCFGIHKFLLGYKTAGLTMLLLSILSFGFLSPLLALVGFIEGVIYLSKPNKDFYETYIQGKKPWF